MRSDAIRAATIVIALLALSACTTTPVQPWERGRLARWDMRWDPDPLQTGMDEHTYFSKEGSAGRIGAAGGGCGCN
jgi:hypothetical protein